MSDLKDQIRALLKANRTLQRGQLVKLLPDFRPDTISVALNKMQRMGEVGRDQHGWYLMGTQTPDEEAKVELRILSTAEEVNIANRFREDNGETFRNKLGDMVEARWYEHAAHYAAACIDARLTAVCGRLEKLAENPEDTDFPDPLAIVETSNVVSEALIENGDIDEAEFHAEQTEDDEQCAYVFHVEHDGDYIRIAGNSRAVLRAIGAVTKELLDESL